MSQAIRCPTCQTEIGGMNLRLGPMMADRRRGGFRQELDALCPVCDTASVGERWYPRCRQTLRTYSDWATRQAVRENLGLPREAADVGLVDAPSVAAVDVDAGSWPALIAAAHGLALERAVDVCHELEAAGLMHLRNYAPGWTEYTVNRDTSYRDLFCAIGEAVDAVRRTANGEG